MRARCDHWWRQSHHISLIRPYSNFAEICAGTTVRNYGIAEVLTGIEEPYIVRFFSLASVALGHVLTR
jgi:hypothetical protein